MAAANAVQPDTTRSREVAARYNVPLDQVLRFDLNTSPAPPELVARILAAGAFETPLS